MIVFEQEPQPQARVPYIIVPDEDFSIDRSTLDLAGLTKDSVSIAGISFIGSYIGDVLPAFTGGEGGGAFYIDIIDSTPDCLKAKLSTEKSVVGALRAYLQVSWDDPYNHGGTKGEPSEKMGIVLLDEGTGIDEIQNSKIKNHNVEGCAIYDLSGRKVNSRYSQRPEGIYIKGGKKFIAM